MSESINDLLKFLDHSLTSWHATEQLMERLKDNYKLLKENEKWTLERGKRYMVKRGGSLCAFSLPENKPTHAHLFASHTDSPALKLKPCPLFKQDNYVQLSPEVYGAPLLSSWLNRDLHIAGRLFVKTAQGRTEEKLVHLNDTTLMIPQLAIHLDREVNEKGLILNKQDHLNPILGLDTPQSFQELLSKYCNGTTLLSCDLLLVSAEKARLVGFGGKMIASSRLDNLLSAHAMLTALLSQSGVSKETLTMTLFFDHEEIGSGSAEGADSSFLEDTLHRLFHHLSLDPEEQAIFKSQSLCLSVDAAHALNPNYPKKQDPHHSPLFEKGTIVKYNANQKYASDALSSHRLIDKCMLAKIPYQSYAPKADQPCGSTVGPILARKLGIATIDIGPPLLSMHSIREMAAVADYHHLVNTLSLLYA